MLNLPLFEFRGAAILFDYGRHAGRLTEETIREVAPHLATEEEFARFGEEELSDREGIRAVAGAAALLAALPAGSWALVTPLRGSWPTCVWSAPPKCFHRPVSADDVRHRKPDPEGVLLTAQLPGVEPAKCLVIEDTPTGFQAARAGGMHSLGILTTTVSAAELVQQQPGPRPGRPAQSNDGAGLHGGITRATRTTRPGRSCLCKFCAGDAETK